MTQRIKPRLAPPPPAKAEGDGPAPARLDVRWRIVLLVWALAFGALLLYELWDFLCKGVRGLF